MIYEQALKVLDLSPNYTPHELKTSYRQLSKKYHPDVNGGSDTKFRVLTEAYNFLNVNTGRSRTSGVVHSRPKAKSIYHGDSLFDYVVK